VARTHREKGADGYRRFKTELGTSQKAGFRIVGGGADR